jgi:DNA segregation ATPase FtsK/SpoIIIE, S-DNA-T family
MSEFICKNCGHDESKCTFDEVVRRASQLIRSKNKASAALLQRDLKISYSVSMNVLDVLEREGLIGPADGANPREVYDHSHGS